MPGTPDHALLADVSAAVHGNPFSTGRHAIDLRIANADGNETREGLLAKVIDRIRRHLATLGPAPLDITRFDGPTRTLVEHALLFVLFHEFSPSMDAHIQSQLRAPSECLSFDRSLTSALRSHRFGAEAAAQMTGVIFQMRRAFYFIDRALTGAAPCMRTLREQLWTNVMTNDVQRYATHLIGRMEDFSTIVLGETGSGKGAAAAAIGRSGYIPYDPRRQRFVDNFAAAFTSINLSQFPDALIESELFGHRKGAFTGAIEHHQGVFARCSPHGSVFLDEIGDVAAPVQIKLLRVLQEREFCPVGDHEPKRFSGRVIAATNRDLRALRARGAFRDDFYYRLCSDVIEVPPLRQRLAEDQGELGRLVAHLVARIAGADSLGLADALCQALQRDVPAEYDWPGNVRELEQALRRLMLGRPYRGDDGRRARGPAESITTAITSGSLPARELVAQYCRLLHQRHGTYEEVARRTGLDRRTVKKHIDQRQ